MTDVNRYGPLLSAISLRAAIDQGDLQDYRIAVITVSRRDAAARAGLTGANGAKLRVVATQLALLKAAADPSVRARRVGCGEQTSEPGRARRVGAHSMRIVTFAP